ncbi:MAG: hypothetical protein AABX84_03295 [Nanoarchaeota archaeon]|mgnify:FL=1
MKKERKEVNSRRLGNLRARLAITEKSKMYLEKELPKLRDREWKLREKISKEKKAISLVNRAKRLR